MDTGDVWNVTCGPLIVAGIYDCNGVNCFTVVKRKREHAHLRYCAARRGQTRGGHALLLACSTRG